MLLLVGLGNPGPNNTTTDIILVLKLLMQLINNLVFKTKTKI